MNSRYSNIYPKDRYIKLKFNYKLFSTNHKLNISMKLNDHKIPTQKII